jgi:hypothetical protein
LSRETAAPAAREFPNAPSALDHIKGATGAIKEMVEAGALAHLSTKSQRPTVVILIDVARKLRSDKFCLVLNTRCMNKHLAKKLFKLEGWSDSTI